MNRSLKVGFPSLLFVLHTGMVLMCILITQPTLTRALLINSGASTGQAVLHPTPSLSLEAATPTTVLQSPASFTVQLDDAGSGVQSISAAISYPSDAIQSVGVAFANSSCVIGSSQKGLLSFSCNLAAEAHPAQLTTVAIVTYTAVKAGAATFTIDRTHSSVVTRSPSDNTAYRSADLHLSLIP